MKDPVVKHKRLNSFILFLVQLTFRLLPDTKCNGYKRTALRFAGANVGKNVRICSSVRIIGDSQLTIGTNTWIGHGTWLFCSAPITIGSDVNIAPLCYIGTGTHQIDSLGISVAGKGISASITICDGAWICARSVIVSGITIGYKAILAAGAVVVDNIPPEMVFGGVPAKMIKTIYE